MDAKISSDGMLCYSPEDGLEVGSLGVISCGSSSSSTGRPRDDDLDFADFTKAAPASSLFLLKASSLSAALELDLETGFGSFAPASSFEPDFDEEREAGFGFESLGSSC